MSLYRETAVVLRTYRLGEADRIIVLLTEGRGKVRAVAKGVRKTKSRFGARLEPMTHVALQLYEGRELDTITQAETLDHFRPVREDLDRVARANQVLEAVDQVAQPREAHPALYRMLVGALRALAARDAPLLAPAFFWKLLALEGFHPLLDVCATCGSRDDLVAFDVGEGGVTCARCHRGIAVGREALALIKGILGGQLADVLMEPASAATAEVDRLATRTLEYHLERRLRATGVLDRG